MKILWIVNILFPEARKSVQESGELKSSGGWLIGLAEALTHLQSVQLYVCSVSDMVNEQTIVVGEHCKYVILPEHGYHKCWRKIVDVIKPDIIHIHGTEYPFGYTLLKSCGSRNVIVSIQGLLTSCFKHYSDGLTLWDILMNVTPSFFVKGNGIITGTLQFKRNSDIEKRVLLEANHFLGRTTWDKVHVLAINPTAKYYKCGEILREPFYDGSIWLYSKCRKHTIFVSQASYPIKGVHQLLKALPLIIRHYPDVKVKVAGNNVCATGDFYHLIRYSTYGRYLNRLINRYRLSEHIEFLGPLDAIQMKEQYLKANVFVIPSSIENSPNSLAEAQILGVPCVASYVGGIPDMIPDQSCGYLYRFDEIEMLAHYICKVFEESATLDLSNMRLIASKRHSKDKVVSDLMLAYHNIIACP